MKREVKKAASLVLVLILVLSVVGIGALAVGEGTTISVGSNTTNKVGDTITLPVTISGNPGFAALELKLSYDTEKLTLTGITAGALASNAVVEPTTATISSFKDKIGIIAKENITGDGVLLNLVFEVKAAGEADVSLTPVTFADVSEKALTTPTTEKGTVTQPEGFTVTLDNRTGTTTPATVTGIVSGNKYNGETTFTVACEKACVVMYTTDSGTTCTRLACTTNGDGVHSFTLNVTADTTVIVAIKGDVNADGAVTGGDALMINRAGAKKLTFNAAQMIIGDVNADGAVTGGDALMANRAGAKKLVLEW